MLARHVPLLAVVHVELPLPEPALLAKRVTIILEQLLQFLLVLPVLLDVLPAPQALMAQPNAQQLHSDINFQLPLLPPLLNVEVMDLLIMFLEPLPAVLLVLLIAIPVMLMS